MRPGEPLHAVAWGRAAAGIAGALGASGVAVLHAIEDARLDRLRPEAIGAALAQLIERDRPAAVIGTGSDRSSEVMAHVGARTGLRADRELHRRPGRRPNGRRPASAGAAASSRRLGSMGPSAC